MRDAAKDGGKKKKKKKERQRKYLEQLDGFLDRVAASTVDDGIKRGLARRQLVEESLLPAGELVVDAGGGAQLKRSADLVVARAGDKDGGASGDGKAQRHQGDAAADARHQHGGAAARVPVAGLGDERAPGCQARQRQRGRLGIGQMVGRLFNLALVDGHVLLQRALVVQLGAAHDAVAAGVLGPVDTVLPSDARVHNDASAEPARLRARACSHDDADAVRAKRHIERHARVEMLPQKQIAMVQRRSSQLDEQLACLRFRQRQRAHGQRVVDLAWLAGLAVDRLDEHGFRHDVAVLHAAAPNLGSSTSQRRGGHIVTSADYVTSWLIIA